MLSETKVQHLAITLARILYEALVYFNNLIDYNRRGCEPSSRPKRFQRPYEILAVLVFRNINTSHVSAMGHLGAMQSIQRLRLFREELNEQF